MKSVLQQFLDRDISETRLTNPRTLEFRDILVNDYGYTIGTHHLFVGSEVFELKISQTTVTLVLT